MKNQFLRWLKRQQARTDSVGWFSKTVFANQRTLNEIEPHCGTAPLQRYAQQLPSGHLKRVLKHAIAEWVKESANPQVGIFWIMDGDIIDFTEDVENVQNTGGWKDSPYDHMITWKYMQESFPQLKYKEYTQLPRGRVTAKGSTFFIRLPPDMVNDQSIINKVIKAFGLPKDRIQVEADEHYTTEQMSEFDVDPFDENFDPDEDAVSLDFEDDNF